MRIQVLSLPERSAGHVAVTPWALIVDECPAEDLRDLESLRDAAVSLGAVGALVFEKRVEVVAP